MGNGTTQRDEVARPTDATPLGEAKEWMLSRIADGPACPCCGRTARLYPRKLNANMARFLCSLVRRYRAKPAWYHYKDLEATSRDYTFLRHFGLAELQDNNPQTGRWRPTELGIAFVDGTVTVPQRVYVYQNQAHGFDERRVDIRDALGDAFDLAELMASRPGETTVVRRHVRRLRSAPKTEQEKKQKPGKPGQTGQQSLF